MGLTLNITLGAFSPTIWNQMIIEAARSRRGWNTHKYICRVIYPDGRGALELKTNAQIKQHFQQYGDWNANCAKMQLREIINLTRIGSLQHHDIYSIDFDPSLLPAVRMSIRYFASQAELKYN